MTQTITETLFMPTQEDASRPGSPAPDVPRRRGVVGRTLHDSAYALVAFPLCCTAFVLLLTGTITGVAMSWMVLGLPVLLVTAHVARGFAYVERLRIRYHLQRPAPTPVYATSRPGQGWMQRTLAPLRDPQSWLDIVWGLLSFATGLFASIFVLVWWSVVLNGATYWFWERYLPDGPDDQGLAELIGLGESRAAEIWLSIALGLLALLLLPLAARFAALVHSAPAEIMLSSRARLQAEVRHATGGRDAARDAEAASLRRLERDLHDGPQQRLVRLSMDLGRARHQFESDPVKARAALDEAYASSRAAIDELRALSRGIAPPLLVDRGLGAALEELLARNDERVDLRLGDLQGLPPHVETAVYFVVAEAMTNVAKHAGASEVVVQAFREDDHVVATVIDDGVGGAHPGKGSGLAGLEQRVRGLDGTLVVTSPVGGPTSVSAEIPVAQWR